MYLSEAPPATSSLPGSCGVLQMELHAVALLDEQLAAQPFHALLQR